MDVEAGTSETGVMPHAPRPPPETAAAVSSTEPAGDQVGAGDGNSKSVVDAVVVDLVKVVLVPVAEVQEQERKAGALNDAAAHGQGECASVVVDIRGESAKSWGGGDGGNWDFEKVCRICHLSADRLEGSEGSELIQLGCGCKNELGVAHRHCAEAWFKLKGNRCCEICGVAAKNVTGIEDTSFLGEWNERTLSGGGNRNTAGRARCWRGQPFCNFLMVCLVIAFILPWFFRVKMF